MKIIILFLFVLSLNLFAQTPQEISSSVVFINTVTKVKDYVYETGASGIIVNYKNKQYVLTNAHVCLNRYKEKVFPQYNQEWLLEEELDSSIVRFEISNYDDKYSANYLMSQVKIDIARDICAIPIREGSLFKGKVFKLKDINIEPKKMSKISYYTYNRKNHNKLVKVMGVLTEKRNDVHSLIYESVSSKETLSYKRFGKYYEISQLSIPGDSGSPLFNQNNELIGLVFGSSSSNNVINGGYALLIDDVVNLINYHKNYKFVNASLEKSYLQVEKKL